MILLRILLPLRVLLIVLYLKWPRIARVFFYTQGIELAILMLIPIEANASVSYRWYFGVCYLTLLNYYDALPNMIFINLVSIIVLFGVHQKVHMEAYTWEHIMPKIIDLASYNIIFVLFAMFVTYMNKMHLKVQAQK